MSWEEIALGDALTIKHGYAFKSAYFVEQGSHLVLTPGNFHEGGGFRSRPGKDRAYSGDTPENYILNGGDVIIAMTEQGPGLLGSSAIIPEGNRYLHNQRLGLIENVNEKILDKNFIYFLFNTRGVRGQISGSASGTKVRHTSPERIYRVRVKVPSVRKQKRIADILSAYDDLIENNRRRIGLLERAARELYREWFVRLRFPGYESCRIVDGVPEGWERRTAYDVFEVMSGGTPKTGNPNFWNGDIPFFTPKDTTDHIYVHTTEKTLTEEGLNKCNSKLYSKDTIFITARGTVGKINLAQRSMAMNQSCYALASKEKLSHYFLYFALLEGISQFKSRAVGAVFDAIVVDTFKRIPFIIPVKSLIDEFDEFSTSITKQVDKLTATNRNLTKARDLLLPRLMDGRIAV